MFFLPKFVVGNSAECKFSNFISNNSYISLTHGLETSLINLLMFFSQQGLVLRRASRAEFH